MSTSDPCNCMDCRIRESMETRYDRPSMAGPSEGTTVRTEDQDKVLRTGQIVLDKSFGEGLPLVLLPLREYEFLTTRIKEFDGTSVDSRKSIQIDGQIITSGDIVRYIRLARQLINLAIKGWDNTGLVGIVRNTLAREIAEGSDPYISRDNVAEVYRQKYQTKVSDKGEY